MSRDNTRHSEATTASFASLGHSSVSEFDPEAEAIASTRQLENAYRKAEGRGSSARNNQQREYVFPDEPDYAIDTSALERAFPDFSQVHTSEEDEQEEEEDELSVELGRGPAKQSHHRLDDSRNSVMTLENNVRSSSPAVRLDHITSQSPLKSAVRGSSRRAVSENLRKDAQLRRASLAQKENMDPLYFRAGSGRRDQRRTLSEMHAKVRDAYDGSFIADERPQAVVGPPTRSTRFGRHDLSNQVADAVERASQEAYAKEVRRAKLATSSRAAVAAVNGTHTTNTFADGTHQSFLLPDLPNLSELVSGVYEDGTPVYSRQRTRTTRFVSPPNAGDVSLTREHIPLDAVPIPEDEKALFVSLRLLQDKVTELEMSKVEAQKRMDELRQENAALKARHQDKQGRRGTFLYKGDSPRADKDNTKWEATNLALQNRLDILDRKAQVQEAARKKLTRERDAAISQLGVAYLDSQQLKDENQALKQEIHELKSGDKRAGVVGRKEKDEDTRRTEQTDVTEDDSLDDSEVFTRRTSGTGRSTKDLTSTSARSRSKPQEKPSAKVSTQVDEELYRLDKERAEEALFSLDLTHSRRPSAPRGTSSDSQPQTTTGRADKRPNTGKQRKKRVVVEAVDVSEPVDVMTDDATGYSRKSAQTDEDVTMLSFMDPREIAQLRKTLERERIARKHRQAEETTGPESLTSARQSKNATTLPRKSSLKESRAVPPRPASATGDLTSATRASAIDDEAKLSVPNERRRRHSDQGVSSALSEGRRRRLTDDMTSAYLVPDITLRYADVVAGDLSGQGQNVGHGVTNHDGKNCTVCRRVTSDSSPCEHMHEPLKVPKPIPVSQRMPQPSVYNEEPTLRPAQPPAVALATVLKALEDELSHLKMQLAASQASYNRLDASLSKRRRKAMHEKIEKLFTEIDMKSDQIYALYDVVEGQKQAGQEMTEAEMEVTLQSIGINIPATDMGGAGPDVTGNTDKSFERRKVGVDHDVDEDGDEEELPWEGFESTVEMTGRTSNSHHRY